jgi:hypothetical protein
LIRRKQQAHDVAQLVRAQYGYLVSFVALQHEAGERWDVSRAVGALAGALVAESEKPKKDFGELVRTRREARGLTVEPCAATLPELPRRRSLEPLPMPDGPDTAEEQRKEGEEGAWAGTGACEEARLRAKVAKFRARQAHEALEEAEASGQCTDKLEALEQAYLREVATCRAAWDAVTTLAGHTVESEAWPPETASPVS